MSQVKPVQARRSALQALSLWGVFMIVNVIHHGTIPFVMGTDVRDWVESVQHQTLTGLLVYGLIFLVAPLLFTKGWKTVQQPMFLIPLALAVLCASLWNALRGIAMGIILVLLYLHMRYDLSELGIRSSGWKGDALAVLLIAGLYAVPRLLSPIAAGPDLLAGLQAGALRLLANPATSAEYVFYFGFIASRFSKVMPSVLVCLSIGLMYMLHEMTNPEYWYEGTRFAFIFVGVALACGIYLWRRALPPIWFGDGLARFIQGSFV